jgi:peroxiredoxin
MTIQVGALAPSFTLPSSLLTDKGTPGKPVSLADYRGKKVVLAFYPLDFSPTCSGEISCFREDFSAFQGADTVVLGISVDSAWAHQAFAKQQQIEFPLLADFHPRGAVADSFGLYEADKGITSRATVIIDREGKIAFLENHGLGTARDNAKILAELAKL